MLILLQTLALLVLFFSPNLTMASTKPWSGTWYRKFEKALTPNGTLTFQTNNNSATFNLDVNSGANIGQIGGTLKIESDTLATFQDDLDPPCRLRFTRNTDSIQIEDIENSCYKAGYGGHNVFFSGEFKPKNKLPKSPLSLFEMGIFPNTEIDKKFRALVGKRYDSFRNNLEQWGDESNDQKNIISGGISGVYVYMRAIIIYDQNGNIWAATADAADNMDRSKLYYYTNVAADKNRLPDEIQDWDERFHSEIVYDNKK